MRNNNISNIPDKYRKNMWQLQSLTQTQINVLPKFKLAFSPKPKRTFYLNKVFSSWLLYTNKPVVFLIQTQLILSQTQTRIDLVNQSRDVFMLTLTLSFPFICTFKQSFAIQTQADSPSTLPRPGSPRPKPMTNISNTTKKKEVLLFSAFV